MADYFVLACYAPPGEDCQAVGTFPRVKGIPSWRTGARFGVTVPEPLRLEWNPETAGKRKMLYDAAIPLFHENLLASLRKAGVDNLDDYRTEILDPQDGLITTEYRAVNLIGTIAAADLVASKYKAYSAPALIDVDFDSLVIDPAKTRGARMFRLAETVHAVLIHKVVKEYLESLGGFGLTFTNPAEWVS